MAKLYEIDRRIMECVDMETGEIRDLALLDSLQIERTAKIEGIACYIKNLLSDADAIKAEINALSDREARCRKKAEQLKGYLAYALSGEAFTTAKCAVSFRRSEKVNVSDKAIIPPEYMRETVTHDPDKTAIKEAIKSGKAVAGCELIVNMNPTIK